MWHNVRDLRILTAPTGPKKLPHVPAGGTESPISALIRAISPCPSDVWISSSAAELPCLDTGPAEPVQSVGWYPCLGLSPFPYLWPCQTLLRLSDTGCSHQAWSWPRLWANILIWLLDLPNTANLPGNLFFCLNLAIVSEPALLPCLPCKGTVCWSLPDDSLALPAQASPMIPGALFIKKLVDLVLRPQYNDVFSLGSVCCNRNFRV